MRTDDVSPIYASTLLWGVILLATAAVILLRGVWAGAAVFASAAVGVLLVTVVLGVVDRFGSEPQYDNKLDPWDD
jgi:hypothetical protein